MQVYERGVKAIPLCPDLWIHYITFQMQDLFKDEKREEKIREYVSLNGLLSWVEINLVSA